MTGWAEKADEECAGFTLKSGLLKRLPVSVKLISRRLAIYGLQRCMQIEQPA
jgi:hypothetical protein